jgi:hypothetical protein
MSDDAAAPVPSVEELTELTEAVTRFFVQWRRSERRTWEEEDRLLPYFCRVADALRPLREEFGTYCGWLACVEDAVRRLAEEFDATTAEWGWGQVAEPEPERSAYLAERRAWFAEHVERPRFEAALSMEKQHGIHCGPDIRHAAREGQRLGYVAAVEPERAVEAWNEAAERHTNTPRFCVCRPQLMSRCGRVLELATGVLRDELAAMNRAAGDAPRRAASATEPTPAK